MDNGHLQTLHANVGLRDFFVDITCKIIIIIIITIIYSTWFNRWIYELKYSCF